MAKKKSWFEHLKRFFISDKLSKSEKKEKRRKWVVGRLKIRRLETIEAPPTPPLLKTEEKQSNLASNVAVSTIGAAEIVQIKETHYSIAEKDKLLAICDDFRSTHQCKMEIQGLSAIKIQTTFRGYLARKALRALKGIVKLQAIIRGRAVRRQAITTLKCLQSIVSIQSQVCTRRIQNAESVCHQDEKKERQDFKDKLIKMDSDSQKKWNDSVLSKQEADALILSKKEAAIKRERIKEYSFSHRKSTESEQNKMNGRWKYWLENWVDTQLSKSKELEDLDTQLTTKRREEYGAKKHQKFRQHYIEQQGSQSPIFPIKSSFNHHHHKRQISLSEEQFSSSPMTSTPTYMAATESAKAKSRSAAAAAASFDTLSESYSPCKKKLSQISVSEMSGIGRISQQRSPGLKGFFPGPVKSSFISKDLSFDSEYSFSTWHRQSGLR